MGAQQGAVLAVMPVYEPPTSPVKVTAPPRPVYRHTARSTAKVQSRKWARQESTQASSVPTASSVVANPNTVIPMNSIKQPLQTPIFDDRQIAPVSKASTPGMDPRLEPPPEQQSAAWLASPLDSMVGLSAAPTPSPLHTPIHLNHAAAPTGANPSPTQLKSPDPPLHMEARRRPNSPLEAVPLQSSHNKLVEVWDLRIHNAHGSIFFAGRTDLTKVDLEKAVVLHHLNLDMYPAPMEPPPEGEGLNKPAEVKLYQFKPEKEKKQIAPEKFERLLKRSLDKTQSKHVSYQEEGSSGWVWTFAVQNFNR